MALAPAPVGTSRIKTPFDGSFPKAEIEKEAQAMRDDGATNVRLEKDSSTGEWIIWADWKLPPPTP